MYYIYSIYHVWFWNSLSHHVLNIVHNLRRALFVDRIEKRQKMFNQDANAEWVDIKFEFIEIFLNENHQSNAILRSRVTIHNVWGRC